MSLTPVPAPADENKLRKAALLILGHPLEPQWRMRFLVQFGTPYLCLCASMLETETERCRKVRDGLADATDIADATADIRRYSGRRAAIIRELRRRGVIA